MDSNETTVDLFQRLLSDLVKADITITLLRQRVSALKALLLIAGMSIFILAVMLLATLPASPFHRYWFQ